MGCIVLGLEERSGYSLTPEQVFILSFNKDCLRTFSVTRTVLDGRASSLEASSFCICLHINSI